MPVTGSLRSGLDFFAKAIDEGDTPPEAFARADGRLADPVLDQIKVSGA